MKLFESYLKEYQGGTALGVDIIPAFFLFPDHCQQLVIAPKNVVGFQLAMISCMVFSTIFYCFRFQDGSQIKLLIGARIATIESFLQQKDFMLFS